MSLSPTYRADWLRADILRAAESVNRARVALAAHGVPEHVAEIALGVVAADLARIAAHNHIPELADMLADMKEAA